MDPDGILPAHGDDGQLGQDDGAANGGRNLLGALDSQSNMAVVIADGNKGLESGPLTGTGLLLDGHNLQHLILERATEEEIDDLEFLKNQGKNPKIPASFPLFSGFEKRVSVHRFSSNMNSEDRRVGIQH